MLCLLSPQRDGFSTGHRALADFLVDFTAVLSDAEADVRTRIHGFERGLQKLALDLEELGVWSERAEPRFPPDMIEGLRNLSRREWEILRKVETGQRVEAIARSLFISPNTVRNHLKSIFRKVGVHSQAELRERLGEMRRPAGEMP